MTRRELLWLPAAAAAQTAPPPTAIPEPHFPSRLHLFVWRNWEIANLDRMAATAGARPQEIEEIGRSMGLPAKRAMTSDQLRRLYVTVIRQNWHVLPEDQLIQLLGWTKERFDFTLKEDDFLDHKLGRGGKPVCERIRYATPDKDQIERAEQIKRTVWRYFGTSLDERGEDLFAFIGELSAPLANPPVPAGWKLISPDPKLEPAAARCIASLGSAPQRELRLERFSGSGLEGESFRISAGADAIAIAAATDRGLLQGLYHLAGMAAGGEAPVNATIERKALWDLRYLYSYFALYGDPLAEPDLDPFPDTYLEKLAKCGINGVWLQGLLNALAPSKTFPEFGKGWETRIANLNRLVERAAALGVRVILYLNEPRAMPAAFFDKRPELRGSHHGGLYSLCTSAAPVREWLRESLAHVFKQVPGLGGIFTITMSENHTNCFSHGGAWGERLPAAGDCPRCSLRDPVEAMAELMKVFRDGVRAGSESAKMIHYDWGWPTALSDKMIPLLDKDSSVLSISEWSQRVNKAGIATSVGEYSISIPGPGPRATRNWRTARKHGIASLAKVQFNNTWEISAVPFIPVPQLVLEHCQNLRAAGIRGLMPSWTCGGYASPNLEAAKEMYFDPAPSTREALETVARRRYGPASVEPAVEAWRRFSEAFREFPYGVAIYVIPVQHGPANLLRAAKTGHASGMILFPHDNYKAWCGLYPPEAVEKQFGLMASMWKAGMPWMEEAMWLAAPNRRREALLDLDIARTCLHHFESVANQVRFYRLRDDPAASPAEMAAIAGREIDLAVKQYHVARRQSVIGYEATNHYYYTPLDMVEKVINCRRLIDHPAAG